MASIPAPEEFAEAAQHWNLEKLYQDLAATKGKALSRVEKQYLRGLLCYYTPHEIAQRLHVESDTVRTTLSKSLYPYIREMLMQQAKEQLQNMDYRRVPILLEQAGYRLICSSGETRSPLPHNPSTPLSALFDHLPEVGTFYGRSSELATLSQWILAEQCRLVTIVGLGGIGKTKLVAKWVEQERHHFEQVVWRSLHPTQPQTFAELLLDLLSCCAPIAIPSLLSINQQMSHLIDLWRRQRCLIVLENLQAVLGSEMLAGAYASGYEEYGEWLRRVGEASHRSCLLLTSWEVPREVALLQGATHPVRSLKLTGLNEAATAMLAECGLLDEPRWPELIQAYRGNPLALKIIAATIHDLFDGRVGEFLDQSTMFLGNFSDLLYQQLKRLSPLEKEVLYWLAEQNQSITLSQLRQFMPTQASLSELLQAIESLRERSLLEKIRCDTENRFLLQPVLRKAVINYRKQN